MQTVSKLEGKRYCNSAQEDKVLPTSTGCEIRSINESGIIKWSAAIISVEKCIFFITAEDYDSLLEKEMSKFRWYSAMQSIIDSL